MSQPVQESERAVRPSFDRIFRRRLALESAERERDRYREALEQIRDGIFSGNQAAEWAREALDG